MSAEMSASKTSRAVLELGHRRRREIGQLIGADALHEAHDDDRLGGGDVQFATCPCRRRGRRRSRCRRLRDLPPTASSTRLRRRSPSTVSPGDMPSSSTPTISTWASAWFGLIKRSWLTWLTLLPGLNTAIRYRRPAPAGAGVGHRGQETVGVTDVGQHLDVEVAGQREPPVASHGRTGTSGQSLVLGLSLPPSSKSFELKCTVAFLCDRQRNFLGLVASVVDRLYMHLSVTVSAVDDAYETLPAVWVAGGRGTALRGIRRPRRRGRPP